MMRPNLDLAPVGNCSVSALIDRNGRYVWACAPRVDGDPFFSALMDGDDPEHGFWDIQLEGFKRVDQAYVRNTPVLRTVLTAEDGAAVEVLDFAPRHRKHDRADARTFFLQICFPVQSSSTPSSFSSCPSRHSGRPMTLK